MKRQDIKRLETCLKYYNKICDEFDRLEDSLAKQEREAFNYTQSVADVVKDFSHTASYEREVLQYKLRSMRELVKEDEP